MTPGKNGLPRASGYLLNRKRWNFKMIVTNIDYSQSSKEELLKERAKIDKAIAQKQKEKNQVTIQSIPDSEIKQLRDAFDKASQTRYSTINVEVEVAHEWDGCDDISSYALSYPGWINDPLHYPIEGSDSEREIIQKHLVRFNNLLEEFNKKYPDIDPYEEGIF
jgi:hypothetical protein